MKENGIPWLRQRLCRGMRYLNIHDCPHNEDVSGGIYPLHPSAGGVLLFHGRIVVAQQVTEQAAVIFDV